MAEAIDRVVRRKLISQAAERLWRRQGVRSAGPVSPPEPPKLGARRGGRAAPSRLPRMRAAAWRPWPATSESGAAEGDSA
jgi:hypothetical protein